MHTFRPLRASRFTRYCLAVGTLSGVAVLGFGGQIAWADTTCTPPANGPTGPDANTFAYQCDGTYAGDWTNSYYVYNPSTGFQTPLYSPDYSYDCSTNTWTQVEWDYNANNSTYVENRVPATTPAGQATNCASTQDNNTTNTNTTSGSATSGTVPDTSNPGTTPTSGPAATAPPDPNTPCPTPDTNPGTSNSDSNANNSVTMDNSVCSDSQSGDASVTNNGTAGNATSGDATTEVDVANLVQSLANVLGAGTATFNVTIDQTVNGNFILDPSTIMAGTGNDPSNTTTLETTNAAINNNVTAIATSGDATVSGNGEGGNALTGDAEAIVNLINMINSAVAAGHSFIGTINITGDLNGNILIPQSVIDQILASNTSAAGGSTDGGTTVSNNNESITNNVSANATSGDASVTNTGTAGNATSGNTSTNVTIMNLTGSSIVGQNVLLVFVNVLGHWVGMIVNAPTGATSAEFGGGVTSDTPSIGNNSVEADANLSITNNVNASATSGDASVSKNWVGGNATSGDASTAVNILNLEDSTLSLANWFGILFINVFGTWNGNFGILPTPTTATSNSSSDNGGTDGIIQAAVAHPRTHFATFESNRNDDTSPGGATTPPDNSEVSAILGDSIVTPTAKKLEGSTLSTTNSGAHANYLLPALGFIAALLLLVTSERDRLFRRNKD